MEFEKELEPKSTVTEGTKRNTEPPATLLEPDPHDLEVVADAQFQNEQLLTRKMDEVLTARRTLKELKADDEL